MRARLLFPLLALLVLTACSSAREAPAPGTAPAVETGETAVAETGDTSTAENSKAAAARYARLDPRLRPDWSSRTFFPPEYCWHVVSMDRAHPLYWDIRKFCRKKRGRRTRR